jgi:hypothetical protein
VVVPTCVGLIVQVHYSNVILYCYTLLQAAQEKTVLLDYVQELLAKQNEMHTVTDMLQRTKDVSNTTSVMHHSTD